MERVEEVAVVTRVDIISVSEVNQSNHSMAVPLCGLRVNMMLVPYSFLLTVYTIGDQRLIV